MHFPKIKPQYYSFIIITVLLLGIVACRDFEDCRSMYTNMAVVEFKGESEIKISETKCVKGSIGKSTTKKKALDLEVYLHPKHNMVTLLFYKATVDTSSFIISDSLTIFYHTVASLLSPNCGIQQEYIIDSVETSFAKGTIIKSSLKKTSHETSEEKNKPNVKIQY
jgi:hypothetical protein